MNSQQKDTIELYGAQLDWVKDTTKVNGNESTVGSYQ